ncbi:MAG: hypothetical protein HYX26_05210 [Acidobacteriales bacterium]|nr:hypothetical protein [Terriglobales bacterium]
MEVKVEYSTVALCHVSDLWEVFQDIQNWRRLSSVFGDAGWVHGKPWERGSRFCVELNYPKHIDLEVVVLKCHAPHEVVLLCHGSGFASEQWLFFTPRDVEDETQIRTESAVVGGTDYLREQVAGPVRQLLESWFDGLKMEAEKHCSLVAL